MTAPNKEEENTEINKFGDINGEMKRQNNK